MDSQAAAALARDLLAKDLQCAPDALGVVSVEAVAWSDSSLGCPAPGMMYTQALVPGYKLMFSDGMRTYEIHTGRQGTPAIWCDHGRPRRLS